MFDTSTSYKVTKISIELGPSQDSIFSRPWTFVHVQSHSKVGAVKPQRSWQTAATGIRSQACWTAQHRSSQLYHQTDNWWRNVASSLGLCNKFESMQQKYKGSLPCTIFSRQDPGLTNLTTYLTKLWSQEIMPDSCKYCGRPLRKTPRDTNQRCALAFMAIVIQGYLCTEYVAQTAIFEFWFEQVDRLLYHLDLTSNDSSALT